MAKKAINQSSLAIRRGIKKRRETLNRRIEMGRVVLPVTVLEVLDSANATRTDFDVIAELLITKDSAVRIAAAACLEELASAWDGKSLFIKDAQTRPLLLDSINDDQYQVQHHILGALAKCRFGTASDAMPLVLPKLNNHVPQIQIDALIAIRSFGVDESSKFIDEITPLVNAPIPEVQLKACETLRSIGVESAYAVHTLLSCLEHSSDKTIDNEFCFTIMKIDPRGGMLATIEDTETRSRFINALRTLGPTAREYRLMLQSLWSGTKTPEFQIAGYTKTELAKLIGVNPKTIHRWIKKDKFPIQRIEGPLHFVEDGIIERLRETLFDS